MSTAQEIRPLTSLVGATGSALRIRVRAPVSSDEGFLFRTWLDSFRAMGPTVKKIPARVYYPYYHRVIELAFAHGAIPLVACPPDDDTVIYGYLIYNPNLIDGRQVLHWLYVKATWRRLGVAKALLEAVQLDPNNCYFTHWTTYELTLDAAAKKEAQRRGLSLTWSSIRKLKADMVAEREALGNVEGDTRVLLKKWPNAVYNPLLLQV